MNANERELLFKDEVYNIIGAAMEVSNELGSGFLEAVYQEALEIEMKNRDIFFKAQHEIAISYKSIKLNSIKNYCILDWKWWSLSCIKKH